MNLFQPSNEYLINCVKDGNIEKTAVLFDRHHKNIYSYFYRLTRNRVESEDLTQNVFVRLIKYRNTYKLGHQFLPWVFSIAHNVFIDYCKLKSKEFNCHQIYEDPEDVESEKEVQADQLEKFYKAFNQLPIEYRELLVMNRYHELTYKQIGEALGLNEKSVKQKAFRALEKLREEYRKVDVKDLVNYK